MNSAKRLQPKARCAYCANRGTNSAHKDGAKKKVCKHHLKEVLNDGWTVFGWF